MNTTWDVKVGDAMAVLPTLEAESIQCVVTSPPYYSLRDYGLPPTTWPDGWSGCLGLEPTPAAFIAHLVDVFREVRRVLRPDGVVWVNMGDSYSGYHGNKRATAAGVPAPSDKPGYREAMRVSYVPQGPKQRLMMPARVALALQADGWWLRSEVVWAKPNPMPSSVTDRPTDAHEMLYLLTKRARYFYDADAVREGFADEHMGRDGSAKPRQRNRGGRRDGYTKPNGIDPSANGGRNKRTWWVIPTQPYRGAHFATYPEALVRPCVLAGTSERGACSVCGAPWRRVVEAKGGPPNNRFRDGLAGDCKTAHKTGTVAGAALSRLYREHGYPTRTTTGWEPTCGHDAPARPCVVLDPFCGSGTTGAVALKNGCSFVGVEPNPDYAALARKRISKAAPSLFSRRAP